MRQSLHRLPPKRGYWAISRDRNAAAARQAEAAAALPLPGGIVPERDDAPPPAKLPARKA